jgi:hypothetical protein
MTRCGRRSPSDDAQVVRVARERDDIVGKNRAAGVPARWMSREALRAQSLPGSDSPVSPARAIEDVRVRATDRLPATTRRAKRGPLGPTAPRERRIRSERFWPKTRPPRELHRNESAHSGKPQGRRNHRMPDRFASVERPCVRGPVGAMKRRSGIVRRPAAPDSASAASERCRGRKPQERRPISNRAVGGRHSVSSPEVAAGRAGRA